MEYIIRKELISFLRRALNALKKEDTATLDEISNKAIKHASIFQDKDAITNAVVMYALAKIVHRSESNPEYWKKI